MKKRLALLNLLSVIIVVAINYISQAVKLNNTTIGELSGKYENLFTPASFAFAIWGLIFLGLLTFALFQVKRAFFSTKESPFIKQIGYWFAIANILNASWVFAFVYEYTGLSVLIMVGILYALIKIVLKTNMERWDAPIEIIAFVWWPICIYSGWIAVATIANISAFLIKIGWQGAPFTEEIWTLAMIIVACGINLLIIWKRNMREFAAVGIWALIAIYFRHMDELPSIAYTALGGGIVLGLAIVLHGAKNYKTNPVFKLLERFNK